MQRRKKQKNELERWTERAAEGIIFRPDQREVERELLAHLEDKAADLARIFPDMEREEAEKRAVEQMGDPKEIGRALARLHRPWLGWLWRLSQIALAWAVLWSLREAVPDLLRGNQYWFQEQVYLSAQDCYLMGGGPLWAGGGPDWGGAGGGGAGASDPAGAGDGEAPGGLVPVLGGGRRSLVPG